MARDQQPLRHQANGQSRVPGNAEQAQFSQYSLTSSPLLYGDRVIAVAEQTIREICEVHSLILRSHASGNIRKDLPVLQTEVARVQKNLIETCETEIRDAKPEDVVRRVTFGTLRHDAMKAFWNEMGTTPIAESSPTLRGYLARVALIAENARVPHPPSIDEIIKSGSLDTIVCGKLHISVENEKTIEELQNEHHIPWVRTSRFAVQLVATTDHLLPRKQWLSFTVAPSCLEFMVPTSFKLLASAVLKPLVTNAADELRRQGHEQPKVRISINHTDDCWVIRVTDNAGGISPEIVRNAFEPGVSTKGDGRGEGLYLARLLFESPHGSYFDGSLEIEKSSPKGTTFRIVVRAPKIPVPPRM